MFVDECSNNIEKFDSALCDATLEAAEEVKRATELFHTMKGGAGFFGLSDVANYSAALESMLDDATLNIDDARAEIESLFEALKVAVKKLPEPK